MVLGPSLICGVAPSLWGGPEVLRQWTGLPGHAMATVVALCRATRFSWVLAGSGHGGTQVEGRHQLNGAAPGCCSAGLVC